MSSNYSSKQFCSFLSEAINITKQYLLVAIILLCGHSYTYSQTTSAPCAVDLGESREICGGRSLIITPAFTPSSNCSTIDLSNLNNSNDGLNDFNNTNLTIGDAVVTATRSFSGTANADEDVINSSQTTGIVGIRQGVINSPDATNAMTNTYTFSKRVCNLTMTVWDLDRTDELIITAFKNNSPTTYTISNMGGCVRQNGDTFTSICNVPVSGDLGHKFDITFDDCIDGVDFHFYNANGSPNAGGSYTITWGNGCTVSGGNYEYDCLASLNNSFNGLNDFNNANIKISNATITGVRSFTGGTYVDEDVINNSQTTGLIGIRQGLLGSHNSGEAMLHTYSLSEQVCNFSMTVWDIDRTDELIVNASNNGIPVPFTISNLGECINRSGNVFTAACDIQINTDAGHKFDITFNGCIDQLDFQFYNFNGGNNAGGSYTLTWGEDCTDSNDQVCSKTYSWSGPGNTNGIATPTLTAYEAGVYSVTVTDCKGCVAIDQVTITDAIPDLTCEYRLQTGGTWTNGDCNPSVCSGGQLELSVSPDNFASYQWEGPNGFSSAGNTNGDVIVSNSFTPAQVGTYIVTVTDQNGCTTSKSITVSSKECSCNLVAEIHDQIYQENNSTNTNNHTFTFKTTINGSGTNGWLMYDVTNGNSNQLIQSGANGSTIDLGPIPVDQNGMLLLIVDADNPSCIQSLGVNMDSCIYTGDCTCCK